VLLLNTTTCCSRGGVFHYHLPSQKRQKFARGHNYDPATGRWMSQDPLGFDAGDSNLYRYVANRPTEFTDPKGLQDLTPVPPRRVDGPDKNQVGILKLGFGSQKDKNGKNIGLGVTGSFTSTTGDPAALQNAAKAFGEGGDHFNWYQVVVKDNDPPYYKKDGKPIQLKPPYVDGPPDGFTNSTGDPSGFPALDNLPWYYNDGSFNPKSQWHVNQNSTTATLNYIDIPIGKAGTTLEYNTWLVVVDKQGKFVSWTNIGFKWTWTNTQVKDVKPIDGDPPATLLPKKLYDPLLPE
jgi:uncharacterized protein RhaS with RHS repeats